MFNGIIYNTGVITNILENKNSKSIVIKSKLRFKQKEIGSSICCNGVCLTLAKIKKNYKNGGFTGIETGGTS